MWSISYFDSKEYDWRGMSQQPSLLAKARRSLLQFTPKSFSNLKWQAFASPKRCLQVGALGFRGGAAGGRARGIERATAALLDYVVWLAQAAPSAVAP